MRDTSVYASIHVHEIAPDDVRVEFVTNGNCEPYIVMKITPFATFFITGHQTAAALFDTLLPQAILALKLYMDSIKSEEVKQNVGDLSGRSV